MICSNCEGAGRLPEKKCQQCQGESRLLKNQLIRAKIPAGIHDQAVIRLSGKGEAGTMGGEYGDLFLHISVSPSKNFERIKDDIYSTEHLHVLQLRLQPFLV